MFGFAREGRDLMFMKEGAFCWIFIIKPNCFSINTIWYPMDVVSGLYSCYFVISLSTRPRTRTRTDRFSASTINPPLTYTALCNMPRTNVCFVGWCNATPTVGRYVSLSRDSQSDYPKLGSPPVHASVYSDSTLQHIQSWPGWNLYYIDWLCAVQSRVNSTSYKFAISVVAGDWYFLCKNSAKQSTLRVIYTRKWVPYSSMM